MAKLNLVPQTYVPEKDIAEARETLGDVAKNMTDEQIRDQLACISYLVESWMEEYERKIFNGKTINEMYPSFGPLDHFDEE